MSSYLFQLRSEISIAWYVLATATDTQHKETASFMFHWIASLNSNMYTNMLLMEAPTTPILSPCSLFMSCCFNGINFEMQIVVTVIFSRVLITEAYAPPDELVMYYGRTINGGAHFPFNFELIKLDRSCDGYCISRLVDTSIQHVPERSSPNWVVCVLCWVFCYGSEMYPTEA